MIKTCTKALTLVLVLVISALILPGFALAEASSVELRQTTNDSGPVQDARRAISGSDRRVADLSGDFPGYIWLESHTNGGTYSYGKGQPIRVEAYATDEGGYGSYLMEIGIFDTVSETYIVRDASDSPVYYDESGFANLDTSGLEVSAGRYEVDAILWDDINNEIEDIESFKLTITASRTPGAVSRVAGGDRYGTAAALARKGWDPSGTLAWEGVKHIIIANGESGREADPVSAAGLAGVYDAPILTVTTDSLPSSTRTVITEIAKKNPGVQIHLIGGDKVVPYARWNEIRRIRGVSPIYDRVFGSDRYNTSAAIATRMMDVAGPRAVRGFILIAGDNPAAYFDALAASPVAYTQTMPLLAVKKGSTPSSVGLVLHHPDVLDRPVYVASSSAFIGAIVAQEAPRLTTSSNRYIAAAQIADFSIHQGWSREQDTALASKLPDALTGGAFVGKKGGVVLFTDSASSIQSTPKSFVAERSGLITHGWIIGGKAVLPASQETSFKQLLSR